MRISGTEPSSVILSQTSSIKIENNEQKVTKQAEAKRNSVLNQQNFSLNNTVWLRITDEGSVAKMHIWSIFFIKSDLKWCIHKSRNLFLYSYNFKQGKF